MFNGFMVEIDDKLLSDTNGFQFINKEESLDVNGSTICEEMYQDTRSGCELKSIRITYPNSSIVQRKVEVVNRSTQEHVLTRVDSFNGILPKGDYTLHYYECKGGGVEFDPYHEPLEGTKILESTSGRSSRGNHPWFTVEDQHNGYFGVAVAWSGNWIARFEPEGNGTYRINGGLSNWQFSKTLKPGETMVSVPVIYGFSSDLGDLSNQFGNWGQQYLYPKNELTETIPVAWNHWWPYEDSAINEDVFKENVDVSAELGIDVCVLDSGWFGEADPNCNDHLGWSEDVDWYLKRGDWHKVNTIRFPSGIAALADYVHKKGMKFGIWCEIEALGKKADLAKLQPGFPALRDGEPLDYVCLGNPEARDWAFNVLEHLIVEYKADWIKLDFNLDPQAGCNRTDHGHGEGDGLYEHYQGYYQLLTKVREKYPEVYLENCSSGGLRMDLGLAEHTHGAFLSDPDHTRHHLQLFWAASQMLHPSACYHFTWSQTIVHYDSNLVQNPIQPNMSVRKFDYIMRANMLNSFGLSYRLPEFPDWAKDRLAELITFYKNTGRRFIKHADMKRLTGQTLRNNEGDTWNAYTYVMKNKEEALVYVFRLTESESERTIRLEGLDASAVYKVRYMDNGQVLEKSGKSLMEEGLLFTDLGEENSEVLHLLKK